MVVVLVGASVAPANGGASVPPRTGTVAARWTLWELKERSLYFKTVLAPRRVRITVPSTGVLRFAQRRGPVHGRIICRLSTKRRDRKEYGCGWIITVAGKARYMGAAVVTLYLSGIGFDISLTYSRCSALNRSNFCRTHRPPHPG
jgi:hypothetical protein